jgi:elongation factor 2
VLAVDEHGNVLVDYAGRTDLFRDVLDNVASGFAFACKAGPLCGEPLRRVKVSLREVQLSKNPESRGAEEVMRGVGKAIFGSFLTAEPRLLEPVYRMVVSAPAELAGECSRIVSARRGEVSAFEQKDALAMITIYIPVAETFGLSEELRSSTSGRAFWQAVFDRWERLPQKLAAKTIRDIRKRKGLSLEVPSPERFVEEVG